MDTGELNALLAGNIGDLETALDHVRTTIDPKLNSEAWSVLKQALGETDYHFDDDDDPDDSWFVPKSWLDENADSDPWFRLNARDSSGFETWLACYVAPRSKRESIGIQWYNNLYVRKYKSIADAHLEDLQEIERAGFHRDGHNIYLPIEFSNLKFAEAFREGDFAEALAPIATAAQALSLALPAFDRLRASMVAATRG